LPHHKFIEEKELEKRFGEEYIIYKKNTPFVFPKIK
jgi:protein-S-isoprenylcysteine O-methyltransferase Ste14